MSKPVKYVFCLCFICCMLSSTALIKNVDFSEISFDNTKQQIINEEMSAETARQVFASALTKSDIDFEKIMVNTNKMNDGSISIIKVTIYTNAPPDAVKAVFYNVDFEVEVINE